MPVKETYQNNITNFSLLLADQVDAFTSLAIPLSNEILLGMLLQLIAVV